MTFLQLLNSLDELLFEVLSWFIFFPATMGRVIMRPLAMMRFAQMELTRPKAEQFDTAVGPPLFLLLALLIAHGAEMMLDERSAIIDRTAGLSSLVTDHTSLLVLRLVVFGIFAMVMAALSLAARRARLTRAHLMPAFYAQCYPVGVFALLFSLGADLAISGRPTLVTTGIALSVAALLWTVVHQVRWFARQTHGRWLAVSLWTLLGFALSFGLTIAVGLSFD